MPYSSNAIILHNVNLFGTSGISYEDAKDYSSIPCVVVVVNENYFFQQKYNTGDNIFNNILRSGYHMICQRILPEIPWLCIEV